MKIEQYLEPDDIHDLQRETNEAGIIFALLAALAALILGANAYLLFWKGMNLFMFCLIHLCVMGATGFYAYLQFKLNNDVRYPVLLMLTGAFFGVIGAAGTLAAWLLNQMFSMYSLAFADWYSSIFPRTPLSLPERINHNIISGRDESAKRYSVIPFLDIMAIGSEAQKREALSKMTSMFHPSFAPAFLRALTDSSNTIRVQAATSIIRIENTYLEHSMQVDEVARNHPEDPDVILGVAHHYDDYAFIGLLDEEFERANRAKALKAYEKYIRMKPHDTAVRTQIGRLLVRNEDFRQAADWFRTCLKEGHENASIISWYMECLFRLGEYEELRRAAEKYQGHLVDRNVLQPGVLDAIRLWSPLSWAEVV